MHIGVKAVKIDWCMYPSDLTDAQWIKLEPLLKPSRGNRHAGGRPRKYDSLRRPLFECEECLELAYGLEHIA